MAGWWAAGWSAGVVGPVVGGGVVGGVVVPEAYVSNSAILGVPVAPVISKLILRSEVAVKLMAPAPLPVARVAPVSLLTTRQEPMTPTAPAASRMLIEPTVVAEPHLIEMRPVDPAGDQ